MSEIRRTTTQQGSPGLLGSLDQPQSILLRTPPGECSIFGQVVELLRIDFVWRVQALPGDGPLDRRIQIHRFGVSQLVANSRAAHSPVLGRVVRNLKMRGSLLFRYGNHRALPQGHSPYVLRPFKLREGLWLSNVIDMSGRLGREYRQHDGGGDILDVTTWTAPLLRFFLNQNRGAAVLDTLEERMQAVPCITWSIHQW